MRLVVRAHVDKVLRAETGQAIGVIATVKVCACVHVDGGGGMYGLRSVFRSDLRSSPKTKSQDEDAPGASYQLIVWSEKAVIAAGGSLHTPALLLRSKLKHPKIGRHLALVRRVVIGCYMGKL